MYGTRRQFLKKCDVKNKLRARIKKNTKYFFIS